MTNLESTTEEMDVDFDRIRHPRRRFDRTDEVPGAVCDQFDGGRNTGRIVTGHVGQSASATTLLIAPEPRRR